MQYPVSGKHFERPVVHANGNVHGHFLIRIFQILVNALFEAELFCGFFKTRFRVLVYVHLFRCWRRRLRHFWSLREELRVFSSAAHFARRIAHPAANSFADFSSNDPSTMTFSRLPTRWPFAGTECQYTKPRRVAASRAPHADSKAAAFVRLSLVPGRADPASNAGASAVGERHGKNESG